MEEDIFNKTVKKGLYGKDIAKEPKDFLKNILEE